ncbi:MAG: DUF5106 domain-containing protein [Bacteroidetes bacterium]|nr:DUF5106 domain-containing protein [Bacteroidota bacterium]MCL1969519.1 DUF5106 domain-containing protein [Bacteroidota bacterium]MCL1969681.1 DUF5106 domain-containing protein [Bacteroidota bacterium]
MKKESTYFKTRTFLFILFFSAIIFISNAQSGYQIRIKTENIQADSLFVKSYNIKNKKFIKFISLKFENDITIKDKTPLDAGIYIIEADSVFLSEFLISDTKNQKFTISILNDDITIEGSKENIANRAYTKQMMEFDQQQRALTVEFQQMKQKELPNSMMQVYVDTFMVKLAHINAEKKLYQEKVISENKGVLLASIIQCSIETPPPPQAYYRDKVKYLTYVSEHHFDYFTWDDERLLNTPVLYNSFRTFAQQILPLDSKVTIPIVLKALNESKKTSKLYYALFDFLEQEFGNVKALYRDEQLYIAMLKDILNTPNVEETRRLRYEYELNLITKNQPGEQATDFNILLSTGDTTTLYAIDAEVLLIYFQNPDCPTCVEYREKMKNIEALYRAIASGRVKVLTLYFEPNEELWRNYLAKSAYKNWMHGWNYDLQISEKHLYDVRIIPTVIVLDKNKKVIEKDIFPNELEEWIKRNL